MNLYSTKPLLPSRKASSPFG